MHNKPPVNGRLFTMEDVLFSWNRFKAKSPNRIGIVNEVNADAPVLSVTNTDTRTIVVKLKEPLVYALDLFASNTASHSGSILMIPKETDTTFNIGTEMIGAGPYYMDEYAVSQGFKMKRHAEYYDQEWGYLDAIEFPIISESTAALAQFKAGRLLSGNVPSQDLLAVKREEPRILLFATDVSATGTAFTFGLLPEGKSPFLDERVRQAASMSWDRDLFIDATRNVSNFAKEGLTQEIRWNSALGATWDGWWLDPQGKDFGPNAKFYQHDLTEAKRLLSAAGYPNGVEVTSNHIVTNQLGDLPQNAEIMDGMMAEAGFRSTLNAFDYATEYIPKYRDGHGQYEGWAYHTNAGGTGIGPVGLMSNEYWYKGGSAFKGFSASGRNDQSGDPVLNGLIEKARIEQDENKRRALVYDIQRQIAGKMWGMILPGGASGFTTAWPALGNFRVYRGPQVWGQYRLWLDTTKAPFA
jgi:peptide/nickel transport system substrate-binding protein